MLIAPLKLRFGFYFDALYESDVPSLFLHAYMLFDAHDAQDTFLPDISIALMTTYLTLTFGFVFLAFQALSIPWRCCCHSFSSVVASLHMGGPSTGSHTPFHVT